MGIEVMTLIIIWEYSPTLTDEFCFCIGETGEHVLVHWAGSRVNTSYEQIVSCVEWPFQTRKSEFQSNSATHFYDDHSLGHDPSVKNGLALAIWYHTPYSLADEYWKKTNPQYHHHSWGPYYLHGLSLIPAWISKVCDEITYSFLNFNGCNHSSLGIDKRFI